MLRILLIALLLVPAAIVPSACKKVSDKKASELSQPVSASRPISELGDVVATLQLPSGSDPADLAKLVDNIQPGMSGMMSAQMPMLLGTLVGVDLSGADLKGPVSILLLNPEKYEEPAALLVKSSKPDALVKSAKEAGKDAKLRNGQVLIGSADTLAAAEAFAFANLVKPSQKVMGTIYPAPLVVAYQARFDQLTETMSQSMGAMGDQGPFFAVLMKLYKEMFSALGEQSDRLVMSVGTEGSSSEIYMQLFAKPGTTLDSFIQAQVPADHKLLALLPKADTNNMIFSGDMRAGAARDAIFQFSMRAMAALYDQSFGEKLKTAMTAWLDAFDGAFAANIRMEMTSVPPRMAMSYLMGSSDTDKMRKSWRDLMSTFADATATSPKMMGMKFKVDFKEKASEHDGVEIDDYTTTLDPSQADPQMAAAMASSMNQKLYMAAFDKVAAMSMATEGAGPAAMEEMIDSARGKAESFAAEGKMADAIERSKQRKESMLMIFDVSELAKDAPTPPPFALLSMGLGKDAGGALTLRISISR